MSIDECSKTEFRIVGYAIPWKAYPWYGVISLLSGSEMNHAQIEVRVDDGDWWAICPCVGRDTLVTRVFKSMLVRKHATFKWWTGFEFRSPTSLARLPELNKRVNPWKLLMYHCGGRWVGMREPFSCVAYVRQTLRCNGFTYPPNKCPRTPQALFDMDCYIRPMGPQEASVSSIPVVSVLLSAASEEAAQ